jgi:hypothetical protein
MTLAQFLALRYGARCDVAFRCVCGERVGAHGTISQIERKLRRLGARRTRTGWKCARCALAFRTRGRRPA